MYSARRHKVENVGDWTARVKSLAANCGFGIELQTVLQDVFVVGIVSGPILERLMEEDASAKDTTQETVVESTGSNTGTGQYKLNAQSQGYI